MTTANDPSPTMPVHDRWCSLLIISLAINFGSALIFPMYVTDAFSWPAWLACLLPIAWAGWLLFRCRSRGERWVSYVAVLGALYWLVPAIGLVAEFTGR